MSDFQESRMARVPFSLYKAKTSLRQFSRMKSNSKYKDQPSTAIEAIPNL